MSPYEQRNIYLLPKVVAEHVPPLPERWFSLGLPALAPSSGPHRSRSLDSYQEATKYRAWEE